MNHKQYYCYQDKGNPVIVESEPRDFRKLPDNFIAYVPTLKVAELAYKTNLRIETARK